MDRLKEDKDMKVTIVIASLVAVFSLAAFATGTKKDSKGKNQKEKTEKVEPTPTPWPTDGLTREQADALDSIPNSSEIPQEERIRMEKEFEKAQAEVVEREKQRELMKKKK